MCDKRITLNYNKDNTIGSIINYALVEASYRKIKILKGVREIQEYLLLLKDKLRSEFKEAVGVLITNKVI